MKRTVMLSLFFVLAMAGGTRAAEQSDDYFGFLMNSFGLGPEQKGFELVYSGEDVNFGVYKKVMIDQVALYLNKDPRYKDITQEDRIELANSFQQAYTDVLGTDYPVVNEPGPDVLRLRMAISDVTANSPILGTTLVVAMAAAPGGVVMGMMLPEEFSNIGGASMQLELIDGQTNELIGAGIDRRAGTKLEIIEGMSRWGHAKKAFEVWARGFRDWFDKVHGVVKKPDDNFSVDVLWKWTDSLSLPDTGSFTIPLPSIPFLDGK